MRSHPIHAPLASLRSCPPAKHSDAHCSRRQMSPPSPIRVSPRRPPAEAPELPACARAPLRRAEPRRAGACSPVEAPELRRRQRPPPCLPPRRSAAGQLKRGRATPGRTPGVACRLDRAPHRCRLRGYQRRSPAIPRFFPPLASARVPRHRPRPRAPAPRLRVPPVHHVAPRLQNYIGTRYPPPLCSSTTRFAPLLHNGAAAVSVWCLVCAQFALTPASSASASAAALASAAASAAATLARAACAHTRRCGRARGVC
jgi:hypothetical protein